MLTRPLGSASAIINVASIFVYHGSDTGEPESKDNRGTLLTGAVGEMTYSNQIAITNSLLIGLSATLGTILIHALVVHNVIIRMCRDLKRGRIGGRIWENLTFIGCTTLLSLAGHFLEVTLWAFVFDVCGGVADFRAALYCSAGSYTTVGSGDIVLSSRWKLLGPIEATVGVLMFGISTALIFAVIQRLIQARLEAAEHK